MPWWSNKWPLLKYIELTEKIKGNYVILGSKEDKSIAKEIIESSQNKNIYDLTGDSIQETKEIMERCKVIVTHDSGGLHIASTTKTKVIALFGPTPSKRFAPKNVLVVQRGKPCYDIFGKFNCKDSSLMDKISIEEIRKYI